MANHPISPVRPSRPALLRCCGALLLLLVLAGCAARTPRNQPLSTVQAAPLLTDSLQGNLAPVHDPSLYLQNGTFYLFTTDPVHPKPMQYLPIRCSADLVAWRLCGQVFTTIPTWVRQARPGLRTLWAPDISFFNGLYHVYYAGSTLGSQNSVIGLATNTTLDPADPTYGWVDRGEVLASHPDDDFNAIDPNILVDRDGRVWMQYGSYWTGIKQREIDPGTGMLLSSDRKRYQLASRPGIPDHSVEGASEVQHGGFYYLFLSIDHCCEDRVSKDDYKQIVGRSSNPHGPFVDQQGVPLTRGGGTVLLAGNERWRAPGGGTVFLNPLAVNQAVNQTETAIQTGTENQTQDGLIVFHALDMSNRAEPSLWVKHITWQNDWPALD